MKKSPTKKKTVRGQNKPPSLGIKFESHLRYLRGDDKVFILNPNEDGIPILRESFVMALIAVHMRLMEHLNGERSIADRDLVGMISQLDDKLRKTKDIDPENQITALVAETLKLLNRNAEVKQ